LTLLYLIRHARSTWNAEGRMQGRADPPLDEVGWRQARALALHLQSHKFDAIYSSPLARARLTAEIVAAPHNLSVRLDPQLMERHLGDWTGLTGDEVDEWLAAKPDHNWRRDGPPGGENSAAVAARAVSAFADILAAHPDGAVAVVSHGDLLKAYFFHLLGIPLERPISFGFENAAITRLSVRGEHVHLFSLGETEHLNGLRIPGSDSA
jgi:broad specificity phosphatase PhoE